MSCITNFTAALSLLFSVRINLHCFHLSRAVSRESFYLNLFSFIMLTIPKLLGCNYDDSGVFGSSHTNEGSLHDNLNELIDWSSSHWMFLNASIHPLIFNVVPSIHLSSVISPKYSSHVLFVRFTNSLTFECIEVLFDLIRFYSPIQEWFASSVIVLCFGSA